MGFEIAWQDDVYDGAPQESSAANFGTKGINSRAFVSDVAQAAIAT